MASLRPRGGGRGDGGARLPERPRQSRSCTTTTASFSRTTPSAICRTSGALLLNDVFRPVVNISYALDYALSGLQPFGYHLTSLLLHMANVVLLFVLVRTARGRCAVDGDVRAARRHRAGSAPPKQARSRRPRPPGASVALDPEVAGTADTAALCRGRPSGPCTR
ncbi:MAG: hypothetical protein MZV65_39795 [Chromatiales bacterium]|nr:hypothetical protein [Chromatiales bacterium]